MPDTVAFFGMTAATIVGSVGVLLLGLSAGVFFTYQNSVLPGLKPLDDRTFTASMNSMNRAILNGWFMLVYLGSALAIGAAAVVALATGEPVRGLLFTASAVVYVVLVLAITGVVNVPLNNALAENEDRAAFETRWVRFNALRVLGVVIALALAIVAVAL
jgi:uncharacterized membrane protein